MEPVKFSYNLLLANLNNSWLAGFTDRKGYFIRSINVYNCIFGYNIVQKGKGNLIMLKQINVLFEADKVYKDRVEDIYVYLISGIIGCSNTFPSFNKYNLLTNKSRYYILWK